MTRPPRQERIAIIGLGAIGQRVYSALRASLPQGAALALLVRRKERVAREIASSHPVFDDVEQLEAWRPTVAVECAGHSAVQTVVPLLLERGVDVILASIGALADPELREVIVAASIEGDSRLTIISGGIGALDALSAARLGGLDTVSYTGRKKPAAWLGSPAENEFDLRSITQPTVIFSGNAADAARLYPKNANVTAAIALAGVGFASTRVDLVADPSVERNVHQVSARGAFGELSLEIANAPVPENPRTSLLAALSIEAKLRMRFERIML
ncbi:MAG TPA: aspartate dehydrogenase [Burkholderiales bacterium]|nr:aspartate dehydrogenase [Burkholderiales bacterium]